MYILELIGEFGAQAVANASGLDVMNAWLNVSVEMERWRDTGEDFVSERRWFWCPGSGLV